MPLLDGAKATPQGALPTAIGDPTTVLVNVFITETVPSCSLVTYMSLLADAKAIP